jgi:peroxiredoxin
MRGTALLKRWLATAILLASTPVAGGDLPALCEARARRANLDFTLADAAGRSVDLRAYRGQVVVLNFWATWCAPCRTEIPWLVEIYHAHRDAGLVVLGVSVDEEVSRIAPFAAEMRMDFPVLVGRGQHEFRDAFGPLLGFPTTVLITRGGDICLRHNGIVRREELEADVRQLLERR